MERKQLTIRLGLGLCALILGATQAMSQEDPEKPFAKSNEALAKLLMGVTKAKKVQMKGPLSFGPGNPRPGNWLFRSTPLDGKIGFAAERYIDPKTGKNTLRLVDGESKGVTEFVDCGTKIQKRDVEKLWNMRPGK